MFRILRSLHISCFPAKKTNSAGRWWLTPVILVTQEAEIRRIMVRSQPGQIVLQDPTSKTPNTKRGGGMAQGIGPEIKPWYYKKTKQNKTKNPNS
jgi:hypothetical protein